MRSRLMPETPSTATTITTRDALFTQTLHCRRKKRTNPGCRHRPARLRPSSERPTSSYGLGPVNRRERIELAITLAVVVVAGVCRYAGAGDVVTFVVSALALAALARLVGTATEQLGARLGSGGASVVQSASGTCPSSSSRSSRFTAGPRQRRAGRAGRLDPRQQRARARDRVHRRRAPQRPAAIRLRPGANGVDAGAARGGDDGAAVPRARVPHAGRVAGHALSLVCAGVLLAVFALTLPTFLRAGAEEHEPARWARC